MDTVKCTSFSVQQIRKHIDIATKTKVARVGKKFSRHIPRVPFTYSIYNNVKLRRMCYILILVCSTSRLEISHLLKRNTIAARCLLQSCAPVLHVLAWQVPFNNGINGVGCLIQ
jgi:hypothetical protein